jgi:hypothetical protein
VPIIAAVRSTKHVLCSMACQVRHLHKRGQLKRGGGVRGRHLHEGQKLIVAPAHAISAFN